MVHFYNPLILLLSPLCLAPIILHLLFQIKTQKVKFTYIKLIEKIVKTTSPKKKLVDIIVLILRCLIILTIILYFARPVTHFNPTRNETVNLVIAVDNSFSTQYKLINQTKFEIFKSEIEKLLKSFLGRKIKVHLVLFNENVEPINSGFSAIQELNNIFTHFKPSYKSTNLVSLINYLFNLYSQSSSFSNENNQNKVLIFTDLAEHILPTTELQLSKDEKFENVDFLICYPDIDGTNFYIKDIKLTNLSPESIEIEFRPQSNEKGVKYITSKLIVNNQLVDSLTTELTKRYDKFIYTIDRNVTSFTGYINIPIDNLNLDNNFYFTYSKKNNPLLVCVIDEPFYFRGIKSKKYYFENLTSLGWDVKILNFNPDIPLKHEIMKYENIVFVDIKEISNLSLPVNEGKKLIIFPPEEIKFEDYETFLEGIEFIDIQTDKLSSLKLSFGENENFNNFLAKFDYQNINFKKKWRITVTQPGKGWAILAKFTDGTPAIVNKDNIYLFTFSVSSDWTNFVHKPLFVGLMKYIIEKTPVTEEVYKNFYFISEMIPVENVRNVYNFYSDTLMLDKNFFELSSEGIKFFSPGIYTVETVKEKINVAINIHSEESNITFIDKGKIKKFFSSIPKTTLSFTEMSKSATIDTINKWCFGKEYSQDLLLLGIILFIVETILSRVRKKLI